MRERAHWKVTVLDAWPGGPLPIESQLESKVIYGWLRGAYSNRDKLGRDALELGLGGAFPIGNRSEHMVARLCLGEGALQQKNHLESDGFEAWPGRANSNGSFV